MKKKKRFQDGKGKKQKILRPNYYRCGLAGDIALLANLPAQAESLLHSLERVAGGIDLHVNANKTEYMCFNRRGDISALKGGPLKLVDKFTYFGSSISLTVNDIHTRLAKAWTANDSLSVIWKSDLINKLKHSFFPKQQSCQYCYMEHLMDANYGEKDDNYTRTVQAVLKKSWRQHPTKQQLYDHLQPMRCTPVDPFEWTRKGWTTS